MRLPTFAYISLLAISGCGTAPAPVVDASVDASDAAEAALEPPAPEVRTALGALRGMREDGVQGFLGIPYALAPVGPRRWRPPEAVAPWEAARDATRRGASCPQSALGLVSSGSEDCLVVNVHTPDPRPTRAPVLVWIHGGAFIFGDGLQTDGGTAGDVLARRYGLVVVSMNYRLGAFGFLASEALGSTGNEGFQDQQLALRWVRDHISAFGGDPERITLAGESAGGLSVCLHLVAPGSRGLFQRAISQSGLCDASLGPRSAQLELGRAFSQDLGCAGAADEAACLRGRPATQVRDAGSRAGDLLGLLVGSGRRWWPAVDGAVLPDTFRAMVSAGRVARVPTVVGWNGDEGTLFVALAESQGVTVDQAAYDRLTAGLATQQGLSVEAVRAAYPVGSFPNPGAAAAAVLGHSQLACPSRRAARALVDAGAEVRVYRFMYPAAAFQLPLPRPLGAFHSAEIQFVFGHPAALGRREFRGDEVALHDAVSGAWAAFVRGEAPAASGVPWPRYEADEASLRLDRTPSVEPRPDAVPCALWR